MRTARRSRTQCSVAVGDGQGRWFLVNASPDLRDQLEACPALRPRANAMRHTPIAGVLLTNSDLDHVLGLFCLREGEPVRVYATNAVQTSAATCLGLTQVLNSFCGVEWREPSFAQFAPLPEADRGAELTYRAIPLPGTPTPFARNRVASGAHNVAYQFQDGGTGGTLLVAPDVAAVNEDLRQALATSDAILFDGTFWSTNELAQIKPTAPSAAEMGHLPIQGSSLELLRGLNARRKTFIHINNTNPILALKSPERSAVEAAGIAVGSDGEEFCL